MKSRQSYLLILILALAVLAFAGCTGDDGDDGTTTTSGGNINTVTGHLTAESAKTDGPVGTAKVLAMVGDAQFPAELDPRTRQFIFDDLPDGTITILVDMGDGVLPVKFPKSEDAQDMLASMIPDVSVATQYLAGDTSFDLDLGELVISADGTYLMPEFNPFEYFDTDMDGLTDWLDDDIDGDGFDNADDDDPWGDDFSDWDWEDEAWDDWDEDGDGEGDWYDDDFAGDYWDMSDVPEWDVCAENDAACWAGVCDDPSAPGCYDEDYCAFDTTDPLCEAGLNCVDNPDAVECGGDPLDCELNPDAVECGGDPLDCDMDPDNPACLVDCELNPEDPNCLGLDEYCLANPMDPECI